MGKTVRNMNWAKKRISANHCGFPSNIFIPALSICTICNEILFLDKKQFEIIYQIKKRKCIRLLSGFFFVLESLDRKSRGKMWIEQRSGFPQIIAGSLTSMYKSMLTNHHFRLEVVKIKDLHFAFKALRLNCSQTEITFYKNDVLCLSLWKVIMLASTIST